MRLEVDIATKCARLCCAVYPPAVANGYSEGEPSDVDAFAHAARAVGLSFVDFAAIEATGTELGIARDAARRRLFIAIRGTAGIRDIITDACAWRRRVVSPNGKTWHIHTGGLSAARSSYAAIASAMARHRADRVILTGHSLGGMVARILRAMLPMAKADAVLWRPLHCFTFGSPRPGCRQLAADIQTQPGADYRIEHATDPVVYVPGALSALTPWPRYKHAGEKCPHPTDRRGLAAHACAHYLTTTEIAGKNN